MKRGVFTEFQLICLCFVHWFSLSNAAVKIWKQTNDVLDKINWEKETNCEGLVFPKTLDTLFSISSISTNKIVLPRYGAVVLQDGVVNFTAKSSCIKIKDKQPGNWFDPTNWELKERNNAVPDLERIPCVYDEVVFPKKSSFNVYFPSVRTTIKSLKIKGESMSTERFKDLLNSDSGVQFQMEDFYGGIDGITIDDGVCMDPTGCICQPELYRHDKFCKKILEERQQDVQCLSPLSPIGHCGLFCGGSVLLKISEDTNFYMLKQALKELSEIDVYMSKTDKDHIQVLFADKERYNKISLKAAENFYDHINGRLRFYSLKSASLQTSGEPFFKGNALNSALFIIFGTLFGVLLFMSSVYYMYIGPGKYRIYFPNFDLNGRHFSSFYFARFDNRDEGGIQFAEEVEENLNAAVDKEETGTSFDNPMFGTSTPLVFKRSDSIQTTATDVSTAEATEMELKSNVESVESSEE